MLETTPQCNDEGRTWLKYPWSKRAKEHDHGIDMCLIRRYMLRWMGNATTLPGTLSAVSDGNGTQVEYNGHPLYTFSSDTAPGQTNGEGSLGKWFVATTSLSASGSGSGTPQTTPAARGGY